MDELLNELDLRIRGGLEAIKDTNEKLHAYKCLLEFQESTLSDLETAKRVCLHIHTQTPPKEVQLGEDRDH